MFVRSVFAFYFASGLYCAICSSENRRKKAQKRANLASFAPFSGQ
jgi:transposase-like protein